MTYPQLDAETDIDLDGPATHPPVVPVTAPVELDAESDIGEWDTLPVASPAAAVAAWAGVPAPPPTRPARPGKAEVTAEYNARAEGQRAARRRRRIASTALTTLIFASAAASVVGWPVVLAALAAAGGTGTVGYAAVKGAAAGTNGEGRGRRGVRGGGAGYGTANNRRRLFGGQGGGRGLLGGGGGGGGRGSAGAGGRRSAGLGSLNPFKGAAGRRAAAQKPTAAKKPAAQPTTGRSRPGAAGKPLAGHRPKPGGGGLLGALTRGRRSTGSRTGAGAGRGIGPRGTSRFGANNRRRQHHAPQRHSTRRGGQQRTPRTFAGQARQARRQAVQQARRQLAQQVGRHNAAVRTQPRQAAINRRIAAARARQTRRATAAQTRRQRHTAAALTRQARRVKARQARRARRLARAAPHRQHWRRRFLVVANRARRHGRWLRRRVDAAGRRVLRRASPLSTVGRRAQVLARLRRLNPAFGARTAHARRWRGIRYYRAQLARRIYAHLANSAPHHPPSPATTPQPAQPSPQQAPPRQAPTAPFRGMPAEERAAVAAALGMAAGARPRQAPQPPRPRPRPRPAPPVTARPRPSTRTPRPAMAVPRRPAMPTPRGTRPMTTSTQSDAQEVTHAAWEAALSALNDSVATYSIPDDGTGVLDVDAFISSIGGFMNGFAGVLDQVGGYLAEGPTHQVVVEQLAQFSLAVSAMAADAGEVYDQWRTNPDNEHDIRRAEGEINRAELFNVNG